MADLLPERNDITSLELAATDTDSAAITSDVSRRGTSEPPAATRRGRNP
jgi:hypothetical protein